MNRILLMRLVLLLSVTGARAMEQSLFQPTFTGYPIRVKVNTHIDNKKAERYINGYAELSFLKHHDYAELTELYAKSFNPVIDLLYVIPDRNMKGHVFNDFDVMRVYEKPDMYEVLFTKKNSSLDPYLMRLIQTQYPNLLKDVHGLNVNKLALVVYDKAQKEALLRYVRINFYNAQTHVAATHCINGYAVQKATREHNKLITTQQVNS